jgi:RNA polymerase sigma factor (sigma-70 family)
MTNGLTRLFGHLQQAGGGLSDGQLLGRFVAARDEASFAALVRRHGPMVLGVCRRVLHDFHAAEDAFQATFLVLARKAASVVKRESVGCWLYGTAYRTAMEARTMSARRRTRERPMSDAPHPAVGPAEAQDWRPLLDRELSLLPEKYRAAIVLCDLEGRTRREAARLLGVTEGTLSSRLARGRTLLAKRLTNCGVVLSGGALAVALAQETASAALPGGLVCVTAKAAALVAAGQAAAVSTTAVLLMQGVMKAMLMKKLRVAVGAVLVLAALGLVGFGYRAGGGFGSAQAAPPDKPANELEALRNENELLKLNLLVVLEKVRAQEAELQTTRKDLAAAKQAPVAVPFTYNSIDYNAQLFNPNVAWDKQLMFNNNVYSAVSCLPQANVTPDPVKDAEAAVKALREAKDPEGKRRATEALEKAVEKLKGQGKAKGK